MLDPDDFEAATEILADEQQPPEIRNAAEEAVIQHLAEVVQDPEQTPADRDAAMGALDAAGYELDNGAQQPVDDLAERLAGIEQYLAETPPSDYTQPPQLDPEQYQRAFVNHVSDSLDGLEAKNGREFSEAEVRRITMAAIEQTSDDYPYPDLEAASAQAEYEHDERTSTREGRVGSMVDDWQQRQAEAEPLTQEHVDDLAARSEASADELRDAGLSPEDGRRARQELMLARVEGNVGVEEGEQE